MFSDIIVFLSFIAETGAAAYILQKLYQPREQIRFVRVWMSVFCLAESVLLMINHRFNTWNSFWGYLGILFVSTVLLSVLFLQDRLPYKLTAITVYLCSLVSIQRITETSLNLITDSLGIESNSSATFILSKSLLVLCAYLMSKYRMKSCYDLPFSYLSILIIVPVLNFSSVFLFLRVSVPEKILLMFFASTLVINLLLYVIFAKIVNDYEDKIRFYLNTQYLQLQMQDYKESKRSFDTLKSIRHDFKNQLLCMRVLLEKEQYDELRNYFDDLAGEASPFLTQIRTGNPAIDAVLNNKSALANAKKIPMQLQLSALPEIHVRNLDLCAILSNLLDNAIEASANIKEPNIKVKIASFQQCLQIAVSNEAAQDVLQNNPKLETTKLDKDSHGLGISIIQNIVKQYDGSISFTAEEGRFHVNVLINNRMNPVTANTHTKA